MSLSEFGLPKLHASKLRMLNFRMLKHRMLKLRDSFGRRSLYIGLISIVLPLLAACSFQPLYSSTSVDGYGEGVQEKLKKIDIAKVPGRVGQKLRNELVYGTTGGGQALPSEYRLELAIKESESSVNVRTDGDARGRIYQLRANFKLVHKGTNKEMFKGSSLKRALFDTGDSETSIFANERAVIDAEGRAARELAEEIKTRLAAYLATST